MLSPITPCGPVQQTWQALGVSTLCPSQWKEEGSPQLRNLQNFQFNKTEQVWVSLVAQWQRMCLPLQETWVHP